jgi:hypothetical protein
MEMASSREKKNPHRQGKKEVMNMELYDDHSILAELGGKLQNNRGHQALHFNM